MLGKNYILFTPMLGERNSNYFGAKWAMVSEADARDNLKSDKPSLWGMVGGDFAAPREVILCIVLAAGPLCVASTIHK